MKILTCRIPAAPILFLVLAALLWLPLQAQSAVIESVAGGLSGSMPALDAPLYYPTRLTMSSGGDIYVTNEHYVRKIDPSQRISTVAGNGVGGAFPSDPSVLDVPATDASLKSPAGVAVDGEGNIYISDTGNHCIRKVDGAGIITIFAGVCGMGGDGFSGDDGPAVGARFKMPQGIAADDDGNVYIADTQNHRIRKVGADGIISTYAGGGSPPQGIGDGGPAEAAILLNPQDVDIDAEGNLYIVDMSHNLIRKVDSEGIISTYAGGGEFAGGYDLGIPATEAYLDDPISVHVDVFGNIYIAEHLSRSVRKVDPDGYMAQLVLDYAGVPKVLDVTSDDSGNLYYSTYPGKIRMVDTEGTVSVIVGNGSSFRSSGEGTPAVEAAIHRATGVAVDGYGNIYIADNAGNSGVRMVNSAGLIFTVPALEVIGVGSDVVVDSASNLYVAYGGTVTMVDPAGTVTVVAGGGSDPTGEGIPATSAQLSGVRGMALDGNEHIYLALDTVVRRVDTSAPDPVDWTIATVAGEYASPGSCTDGSPALGPCLQSAWKVAVDGLGRIFIADRNNQAVQMVDTDGTIHEIFGVNEPRGLAVRPDGKLFVSSRTTDLVYQIDTSGPDYTQWPATTFAGGGNPADYFGDVDSFGNGGDPLAAKLHNPEGLAVDSSGSLYIAEDGSRRIRRINTGNPAANAAGPYLTGPGYQVVLDGSNSYHPDAPARSIVSYAWDLDGDGSFEEPGITVNASWPAAGDYAVALRVEDDLGAYSIHGAIVKVFEAPVAVIESITPQTSFVNETVSFRGSTAENITSWSWSSDLDGTLSASPIFTSSSLSFGTHTISYQVTDNVGRTSAPVTALAVVRPESERTDLALEWGDITFWQNGKEITNPAAESEVTIRAVVHNLSDSDSEPVTVHFFDSYENIDTLVENPVGTLTDLPAIPARGTGMAEISWTTPVGLDGYHVIGVEVDQDASETFLNNNIATRFVVVGDHQAAGNISINFSVQAPSTVFQGSRFTVSGSAEYVWANGSTLPLMGGEVNVKVMGGQEWTAQTGDFGSFSQEIYAPLTPALYTLRVEVTDATLTEFAERQLNVIPLPGPDLTIYNVWLSERVETLPETIYAHVANRGGVDITADFVTHVEVRSPSGQLEFAADVTTSGGLAASRSTTVSFTGWTPPVSGTYEITVTTDWTDTVAEEYETNNSKTADIYVYPHQVDLSVVELKQECDTVLAKVRNLGGLTAAGSTVEFSDGGGVYGTGILTSLAGKDAWTWVASGTAYTGNGLATITAAALNGQDANGANDASSAEFNFTDVSDFTVTDLWVNDKRWTASNIVYLTLGDTLEAEVRNLGCAADSGDLTFRVDGQPMGSPQPVSLAGLGVQSLSIPFTFTNPPYPAATDYELAAEVVGAADAVQGNDLRTETLSVYPALPDYEVLSAGIDFSFDPNRHPSRSEKFSISAQVCNAGNQPGSSWQAAFYEEGQEQIGVVQTLSILLNPQECTVVHPVDEVGAEVQWGTGFSGNHVIMVSVAPVVGSEDDPDDDNNQATRKVWINTPPVAEVYFLNYLGAYDPGQPVEFTGATSHDDLDLDGLGGIDSWEWDFGDSQADSTAVSDTTHAYGAPGEYFLDLTVVDNNSAPSETPSSLSVVVRPVAAFTESPGRGPRTLDVQFSGSSAAAPGTTWWWDFGDGVNSSEENPLHSYTAAGVYSVSLTATGPSGVSEDYSVAASTDAVAVGYLFSADPATGSTAPFDRDYDLTGDLYSRIWATLADVNYTKLKKAFVEVEDSLGVTARSDLLDEGSGNLSGSVSLAGLTAGPGTTLFHVEDRSKTVFTATESITLLDGPPPVCTDGDGDLFNIEGGGCGDVDCNDGDPLVNPGAAEVCDDGIDNDCDGFTDGADLDCAPPACNNDGVCDPGEDCENCENDCAGKTGGKPTNRYCCGNGILEGPEGDGAVCDYNY